MATPEQNPTPTLAEARADVITKLTLASAELERMTADKAELERSMASRAADDAAGGKPFTEKEHKALYDQAGELARKIDRAGAQVTALTRRRQELDQAQTQADLEAKLAELARIDDQAEATLNAFAAGLAETLARLQELADLDAAAEGHRRQAATLWRKAHPDKSPHLAEYAAPRPRVAFDSLAEWLRARVFLVADPARRLMAIEPKDYLRAAPAAPQAFNPQRDLGTVCGPSAAIPAAPTKFIVRDGVVEAVPDPAWTNVIIAEK